MFLGVAVHLRFSSCVFVLIYVFSYSLFCFSFLFSFCLLLLLVLALFLCFFTKANSFFLWLWVLWIPWLSFIYVCCAGLSLSLATKVQEGKGIATPPPQVDQQSGAGQQEARKESECTNVPQEEGVRAED